MDPGHTPDIEMMVCQNTILVNMIQVAALGTLVGHRRIENPGILPFQIVFGVFYPSQSDSRPKLKIDFFDL